MVHGQHDTEAVDEDPDSIENIVSVGTLGERERNVYSKTYHLLTCTRGHDGSSMTVSAFAAKAPLRNVGPRFTVTLANLGLD